MLVDGPLTAIFAGFLLYCEEERWTRVWILAMLAALTRETGLLLGAALLLDRLWQRDWRGAAWFASVGIPAGAWYGYLALRLPHDGPVPIFAIPGWGILRRLFFLRTYPDPNIQLLLRITDLLAVAGLSICIILAARWLRHRSPDPVTLCVSLYAVLTLVLGEPSHMLDAFGFGRPASPLLLWIMLEAVYNKSWAALIPPLLVSLSVSLALTRPFVTVVLGLAGH
jgi:hypothetical protein